jgi:hypothetical protein
MIYPDDFANDERRPAGDFSRKQQAADAALSDWAEDRLKTVLGTIAELRVELIDQAYVLEQRGQMAAADVALSVAVRLDELSRA